MSSKANIHIPVSWLQKEKGRKVRHFFLTNVIDFNGAYPKSLNFNNTIKKFP